jgi:hypothetical protein
MEKYVVPLRCLCYVPYLFMVCLMTLLVTQDYNVDCVVVNSELEKKSNIPAFA